MIYPSFMGSEDAYLADDPGQNDSQILGLPVSVFPHRLRRIDMTPVGTTHITGVENSIWP